MRHPPGKSIGHADGLSRIPPNWLNAIEADLLSTSPSNEVSTIATAVDNYHEVIGNVFDSKDSIAPVSQLISKSLRGLPTKYPTYLDHYFATLWPQSLPETRRYWYHSLTKQKNFNESTYSRLRASVEIMRTHAENNSFSRTSMPCIGTSVDQLDWEKVELLIQVTFRTSAVQVVVYIFPDTETKLDDILVENEQTKKFAQAQEADKSLKQVGRWVRQKTIPTQNDFQGLSRLGRQI